MSRLYGLWSALSSLCLLPWKLWILCVSGTSFLVVCAMIDTLEYLGYGTGLLVWIWRLHLKSFLWTLGFCPIKVSGTRNPIASLVVTSADSWPAVMYLASEGLSLTVQRPSSPLVRKLLRFVMPKIHAPLLHYPGDTDLRTYIALITYFVRHGKFYETSAGKNANACKELKRYSSESSETSLSPLNTQSGPTDDSPSTEGRASLLRRASRMFRPHMIVEYTGLSRVIDYVQHSRARLGAWYKHETTSSGICGEMSPASAYGCLEPYLWNSRSHPTLCAPLVLSVGASVQPVVFLYSKWHLCFAQHPTPIQWMTYAFSVLLRWKNDFEVMWLPSYIPEATEKLAASSYALNVWQYMVTSVRNHPLRSCLLPTALAQMPAPVGVSIEELKSLFKAGFGSQLRMMYAMNKERDGYIDAEEFARSLQMPLTPFVVDLFHAFRVLPPTHSRGSQHAARASPAHVMLMSSGLVSKNQPLGGYDNRSAVTTGSSCWRLAFEDYARHMLYCIKFVLTPCGSQMHSFVYHSLSTPDKPPTPAPSPMGEVLSFPAAGQTPLSHSVMASPLGSPASMYTALSPSSFSPVAASPATLVSLSPAPLTAAAGAHVRSKSGRPSGQRISRAVSSTSPCLTQESRTLTQESRTPTQESRTLTQESRSLSAAEQSRKSVNSGRQGRHGAPGAEKGQRTILDVVRGRRDAPKRLLSASADAESLSQSHPQPHKASHSRKGGMRRVRTHGGLLSTADDHKVPSASADVTVTLTPEAGLLERAALPKLPSALAEETQTPPPTEPDEAGAILTSLVEIPPGSDSEHGVSIQVTPKLGPLSSLHTDEAACTAKQECRALAHSPNTSFQPSEPAGTAERRVITRTSLFSGLRACFPSVSKAESDALFDAVAPSRKSSYLTAERFVGYANSHPHFIRLIALRAGFPTHVCRHHPRCYAVSASEGHSNSHSHSHSHSNAHTLGRQRRSPDLSEGSPVNSPGEVSINSNNDDKSTGDERQLRMRRNPSSPLVLAPIVSNEKLDAISLSPSSSATKIA